MAWYPFVLLVLVIAASGCTGSTGPRAAVSEVTLTEVPATAAAGSEAQVCWRVEGIGSTTHTDLHVSNQSTTPTGTGADPDPHQGESYFPDNRAEAEPGGYEVPGTFCAKIMMPDEGSVFVTAHALDGKHRRHRLSEQREIQPA